MTEADLETIRERIVASRYRVAIIDTASAGKVVVKRQRPGRGPLRAHAVNALAGLVAPRLLRAVPAPGGARAQAIEVRRLTALAAAGVRVPEILHVDPAFIVIRHLEGPSLVQAIEAGGPAGLAAWQGGLEALVEVHARGGYLSQAFARNFIVTSDGLAMIDFEDDPLEAMTLDEAQSRDWLAYLHSTVWLLDRDSPEVRAGFAARLAEERSPVRDLVTAAGRRLAFLRHLPRSRRTWGREVAGLQALAGLFHLSSAAPAKMRA